MKTNEKVRFKYPDVYEKVTSGTKGKAASVFTSLGMYWQLHLAMTTVIITRPTINMMNSLTTFSLQSRRLCKKYISCRGMVCRLTGGYR